ncbi:carbohydrate ABC transporter permease [Vallitalea okinawensis]|uniref:carbohydrate ABC transporter permease n=1 Tax=Vallitalea okinawensis TaxID=2078660 RepID=UPI000CFC18E5|nr:carbohydrate ABC transporter permease [Vallitalea okinawensis]
MNKKTSLLDGLINILLVLFALSALYPILWMIINSFKTAREVIANPIGLPQVWSLANYSNAIGAFDFFRYFTNSGIYTIGTILLTVVTASLFAYATSRMDFRGREIIYRYIQLGLVVPMSIIILSLYVLLGDLGIKNTYIGTILVYTASALPMSILILYAFMRSLPRELEEAAYMDGCGIVGAFIRIILPMVKSAVSTVVIIVFMLYTWNEYFMAFITIDDVKMRPIAVAIGYFSTSRGTEWGMLCAALVITSIPAIIIYLLGSQSIEEALTAGSAIK